MYIAESQGLPFFYSCPLLVNRRKITSFYSHFTNSKQAKRHFTYVERRFSYKNYSLFTCLNTIFYK